MLASGSKRIISCGSCCRVVSSAVQQQQQEQEQEQQHHFCLVNKHSVLIARIQSQIAQLLTSSFVPSDTFPCFLPVFRVYPQKQLLTEAWSGMSVKVDELNCSEVLSSLLRASGGFFRRKMAAESGSGRHLRCPYREIQNAAVLKSIWRFVRTVYPRETDIIWTHADSSLKLLKSRQ